MNAYYCDECDRVIIQTYQGTDEPLEHPVSSVWHTIRFVRYYHPEFKTWEIEGDVRERVETLGLVEPMGFF